MKHLYLATLLGVAMAAQSAFAYDTPGNGSTFSLATLSAIEGSGLTKTADNSYLLSGDITVNAADFFVLEGGVTLRIAGSSQIRVEGHSTLGGDARTLITRNDSTDTPKGLYLVYEGEQNQVIRNLDFEYASLRNYGTTGFSMDSCTFRYSNGKLSSAGALTLGKTGATFAILNCRFEYNKVPAIGGGANVYCGALIQDCYFVDNNQENSNKPQLNLTAGGNLPVTVVNCTIIGAQRTKVGGISAGNMLSGKGENLVTIRNCNISNCRYGINGIGPMKLVIRDCKLVDNRYDPNPNNGGSGISLTSVNQEAVISGCRIEGSLWGVTVINSLCNLGQVDNADSPGNNVFVNNGNNGGNDTAQWKPYDLYNNSANTVYAQNNTWSVPEQTEALIETVIFHQADNPALGQVIFMPANTGGAVKPVADGNATLGYADGVITVGEGIVAVEVYDYAGRRVALLPVADGMADASVLGSGLFILRAANAAIKIAK